MYKIFKIKPLFILLAVASVLTYSGCGDDDEAGKNGTHLSSFGPSNVLHGQDISFLGTGLDRVTSVILPVGVEVPQSAFKTQTPTLIVLTVPIETTEGKVTLKTPDGDIESKSDFGLEYEMVITSMTAEAKPGTNITFTGEFLNYVKEVWFKDDVVGTEIVSQTRTQLVVKVPLEAQTGAVTISNGKEEPQLVEAEDPLTVTLPTVAAMNPASVKHTDNLTITGTGLDLITSIVFTGGLVVEKAEFVDQSEGEIVVTIPVGTLKGKLTLKQASPIDVVTGSDLVIILPVGTNVAPKPAVPGTDNLTITGTNLDLVAELTFPNVANAVTSANFVSQSATQIVVLVPAGAKSGGIGYKTIHGYSTILGVNLIIPGAGPPPLAITLFDEGFAFGGGNWSWGGTADPASTEQFYAGNISFKHTTAGNDGGASSGGMTGVNATGKTSFKFSIYGGPGMGGKQVAAVLGSDGGDKWDSYNSVTIVEGQWKEFSIPLTSYPTVNFANVTRWIFKAEGSTNAVIYVDRVGFD